jgi:hypothetical protein
VAADGTDSDGDGRPDIDELAWGALSGLTIALAALVWSRRRRFE